MLKLLFLLAFAFLFASVVAGQEPRKPLGPEFLRQYGASNGFLLGRPTNFKFAPDNKHLFFLRTDGKSKALRLYQMDLADGKVEELLNAPQLLGGAEENLTPEEKARRERIRLSAAGLADYHLTPDGKKILLPLSGKLFLFDRTTKATNELKTGKGTLIDPKLNHDGSKVAYVLDFDVYVYDLAIDKVSRITHGGTVVKTHGLAEFVAQEEMHRMSGYWWSPDGTMLAVEDADHTGVEQWFVADPTHPDKAPLPQYYPRPGKKNVKVRLGLVSLKDGEAGKEPRWVDWSAIPYTGEPPIEYLAAVKWLKSGLFVQLQDRKQQYLRLCRIEPESCTIKSLRQERDDQFLIIQPDAPIEFGDQGNLLWAGSGSGYEPFAILDPLSGKMKSKSVGSELNLRLDKILSVAPDGSRMVMQGSSRNDPRFKSIYSIDIDRNSSTFKPKSFFSSSPLNLMDSATISKDHAWRVHVRSE